MFIYLYRVTIMLNDPKSHRVAFYMKRRKPNKKSIRGCWDAGAGMSPTFSCTQYFMNVPIENV